MRSWGLRARILAAVGVALALSTALLGTAAFRLAERAQTDARARAAETTAHVIAAGRDAASITRAAEAALDGSDVIGVQIERSGEPPIVRGEAHGGSAISAPIVGGGTVRVFVRAGDAAEATALARLLVLYVGLSALAMLLVLYVALTNLIVTPVERLTRASERLARGAHPGDVPERGAAEVARLARSFNAMSADLRTERVSLEARVRELQQASEALERAQERLVRSETLASVGRLSSGIAHEIGNPLAAILGLVQLLRAGDVDPADTAEFLARIESETERIHGIIRDLLDFARQGATTDSLPDATSDLREVVDETLRLVQPQKDMRGVQVQRDFAASLPRVRGAPVRLQQIVLNLVLNAADAMQGEGVLRITLALAEDGAVCLAVSDTGPGLSPQIRARLFEPFATTKPAGKGTGLGLAVSRSIAEGLGGALTAGDAEGGGARFELRIPRAGSGRETNSSTV